MKKIFILSALLCIVNIALAQTGSYKKGDNLLNIGIGVGSPFFGSGYSASLPVNPSVSFEHGVSDEISVGGQLSYASSKYTFTYPGYGVVGTFKQTAIYVGVRGSYHLNEALDVDDKWDLYGGTSLGYVVVSTGGDDGLDYASGSAIGFGLFAGGKYLLSSKTGIYAELGYQSLSFINVGVAFKF